MKMVFTLGIIPARGGSKGIHNKNIAQICGKPMLAYSIEAARGSKRLNDVILSTDSKKIAECAAKYGLMCDSFRPAELAADDAKTIDVVIYEILQYEKKHHATVDIIVLLQPTAPMRTSIDIDNAVDLFQSEDAESLISVCEAGAVHPLVMYYLNDRKLTPILKEGKTMRRRQDFNRVYLRNGALYIASRYLIFGKHTFVNETPLAFVMPQERSVNIDDRLDLKMAEFLINQEKTGTL
jgi:CMP-N,N'-diacetyllegionaminic acid synthase